VINLRFPPYEARNTEDFLNRGPLVAAVKNLIVDAKAPCTIAVTGTWGVGKTRFLQLLEDSLKTDDHIVIWFDLWKYEATGNVLFALASHVVEATGRKEGTGKFLKSAAVLGKTLVTVAGHLTGQSDLAEKGNDLIDNVAGLHEKKETFQELEANNTYRAVKVIADEFDAAIDLALDGKDGKRAVIIIDDVDRCFPDSIATLFTGIKNYLISSKCVFVIAVDKGKAESAINKVKSLNSHGDSWIEKLISFEINMPRPTNDTLKAYLKYEMDQFESRSDVWRFVYQLLLEEAVHYVDAPPSNPRRFRRFISDICFFSIYRFSDLLGKTSVGMNSFTSEDVRCMRVSIFILLIKHFHPNALSIVAENPGYAKGNSVVPPLHEALKRKNIGEANWTDNYSLTEIVRIHGIRMSLPTDLPSTKATEDVVSDTLKNLHEIGLF